MALVKYEQAAAKTIRDNPELALSVLDTMYRAGKYVARGASGARAKAQKRRARKRTTSQRQLVLSGRATPMRQSAMQVARRPAPLSDRAIAAPVAYGSRIRQNYSGMRAYTVTHTEYIADIKGSVDFSVTKLRVNAADPVTFPWVSLIAPNFEKYKFLDLKFELKPQAPSIKPGVIMMAFDYDPTDAAPISKADMLQYDGAARVNSWSGQSMSMKVQPAKFTSPIAPSTDADLRLTDACNLFVATNGQDNEDAISELWATYTLELTTPQASKNCDAFVLNSESFVDNEAYAWQPSDIVNPSANFGIYPVGGEFKVECLRTGRYVIQFRGDLENTTSAALVPSTMIVRVNGVVPSQERFARYSSMNNPPDQQDLLSTTTQSVLIQTGDILSFLWSGTATNIRPRLYIYPADWTGPY
jgi:hypothetical protein